MKNNKEWWERRLRPAPVRSVATRAFIRREKNDEKGASKRVAPVDDAGAAAPTAPGAAPAVRPAAGELRRDEPRRPVVTAVEMEAVRKEAVTYTYAYEAEEGRTI